jgi:hypothetical protein
VGGVCGGGGAPPPAAPHKSPNQQDERYHPSRGAPGLENGGRWTIDDQKPVTEDRRRGGWIGPRYPLVPRSPVRCPSSAVYRLRLTGYTLVQVRAGEAGIHDRECDACWLGSSDC